MIVGSFVHWKIEKWDNLLSFEDIFTEIDGQLSLDLSHRLARMKFEFFVCVSVSWFISSLKNWEIVYFAKVWMFFYQTWWKSSPWPISQINPNDFHIWFVGLSVGSLFTENGKVGHFAQFSRCLFPNRWTFSRWPLTQIGPN